ncbi:anthrone oxygenase family protein [Nostoc sp.]|uniref:anthrone oxygenase family protein n=1 Tax=Nostoc sp. TaxID=1180 RepID=UPI002FFD3BC7
MPKSKNIYFERQVPREIMRPFSEQLNLFMGFSPLLRAPCPFSSSLTISSVLRWHQPGAAYLLLGSLLYLVGTFRVTIVFNVPLNEALARVEPDSSIGASLWSSYLANWTIWNHIRAAASLAAAASLTIALCDRGA